MTSKEKLPTLGLKLGLSLLRAPASLLNGIPFLA